MSVVRYIFDRRHLLFHTQQGNVIIGKVYMYMFYNERQKMFNISKQQVVR